MMPLSSSLTSEILPSAQGAKETQQKYIYRALYFMYVVVLYVIHEC
jgi:hypothetical protein